MSERYGAYDLLQKIATGGMAEIHLGRLNTTDFGAVNRLVVIKRMLPQLAVRPDFVSMFLDEARLTSVLQHPNIVKVHDLGEVTGSYFIAMELVDGPHLGSMFARSLRARRPLPLDLCAWIAARSADGLHYAHQTTDPITGVSIDLVHRDVSPQNILISSNGEVKITDFGVAKATNQQARTRTGIIKGKVAYMSPEQCLGDTLDARTDVFALGVVLYELVTRRRLFREKSDLLIMQKITSEEVPSASKLNPEVDAGLDLILRTALARELDARYQSANEFAEALDRWLDSRVDQLALKVWFADNCPDLAPSTSVSEPGLMGAARSVTERTLMKPALSDQATMPNPVAPSVPVVAPLPAYFGDRTDAGPHFVAQGGAVLDQREVALFEGPGADAPVKVAPRIKRSAQSAQWAQWAQWALLVLLLLLTTFGVIAQRNDTSNPAAIVPALAPPPVPALVGSVQVETLPSGVSIIVGDRVVGKSPINVEVPVGNCTVQDQFADQPARFVDVAVRAGTVSAVQLTAWVPLIVRSTPGRDRLQINGLARGETPFDQGYLVEPGVPVSLRLEATGMVPLEESVTPSAGESLIRDLKLSVLPPGVETKMVGKPRAPAQDEFGSLSLRTDPWALARWGSVDLGETPSHGSPCDGGQPDAAHHRPAVRHRRRRAGERAQGQVRRRHSSL